MSMRRLALALVPLLLVAACSSDTDEPASQPTLTITGALATGPSLRAVLDSMPPLLGQGDPSSIRIGLYGLWLSESPACTGAVAAEPEGAIHVHDFAANPTLFSAAPPAGSYHCVGLRMSDVIRYVPAADFGNCVAGTEYSADIYRTDSDSTPWHDMAHAPIIGHGSDDTPMDDHVMVVATTDPDAAVAAGFSPHQVIVLVSPLVVPGEATVVVDARNALYSWGPPSTRPCDLEKIDLDFQ